jgi:hypothetical protein
MFHLSLALTGSSRPMLFPELRHAKLLNKKPTDAQLVIHRGRIILTAIGSVAQIN